MQNAFKYVFEVQTANLILSIPILEKFKSDLKELTEVDSINHGLENYYSWMSDICMILKYNFTYLKLSMRSFMNFETNIQQFKLIIKD